MVLVFGTIRLVPDNLSIWVITWNCISSYVEPQLMKVTLMIDSYDNRLSMRNVKRDIESRAQYSPPAKTMTRSKKQPSKYHPHLPSCQFHPYHCCHRDQRHLWIQYNNSNISNLNTMRNLFSVFNVY